MTYKSSIPKNATEDVVKRYLNGQKEEANYWRNSALVGMRLFSPGGELELEQPLKNGEVHGNRYTWAGKSLISIEPFANGLPHGTAIQYSIKGHEIGRYTMTKGTGLDLWKGEKQDGSIYLAEAHFIKNGLPHGWEWWFDYDGTGTLIEERHWNKGLLHGIERQWTNQRRLRKGYPHFYLQNKKVSKAKYIEASKSDSSLPPYATKDDKPKRNFPKEITSQFN